MVDPQILPSVIDSPEKLTIIGGLFGIITAGFFRVWVWGSQLKERDTEWAKRFDERDKDWAQRVKDREAEWVERYKIRESQLQTEIGEWKTSKLRTEDMLERSLALQEQRLRDQEQRAQPPRTP